MSFNSWIAQINKNNVMEFYKFYHPEVYFKDPFNSIFGSNRVFRIYSEMVDKLDGVRFEIIEQIGDDNNCFIIWNFYFKIRATPYLIHGTSHLKRKDGLIVYHRDYWDVGEELLTKIPLVKWFYKKLIKKLSID